MKKTTLCIFSALAITAASHAHISVGRDSWRYKFEWDSFDEPMTAGFAKSVAFKVLLSDFIFVGNVQGFDAHNRPVIDVLQTIYGPTNITSITPDSDGTPWALPLLSTNIFFALTNDWWNIFATETDTNVLWRNRYNIYSWEVSTNRPIDGAVFTNWFIRSHEDGRMGAIPMQGEDYRDTLAYVSNLVQIARIGKDKKKYLDFAAGYGTNSPPCPPCLDDDMHWFRFAIGKPDKPFVRRWLREESVFNWFIDYDLLEKDWIDASDCDAD